MKRLLIITVILVVGVLAYADEVKVKSEIEGVTVFLNGAQVSRLASLNLQMGESELVFTEIPTQVDASSVQVDVAGSVKILSVNYRVNNLLDEIDQGDEIENLTEQIKAKQKQINRLNKKLDVFQEEENILLKNTNFSGKESGVDLEELKNAAAFFRLRLNEIASNKLDISEAIAALEEEKSKLKLKISNLKNVKPEPVGEVVVKINSSKAGKFRFTLSYYLNGAGWEPTYDIRVKDLLSPIELSVKAEVHQKTGEDWNDVNLVLSTANPRKSNNIPELNPWYLTYGIPQRQTSVPYFEPGNRNIGKVIGTVREAETNEHIPFANVILEQYGNQIAGATTDFDGKYSIENVPAGSYDLRATFVGYETSFVKGLTVYPGQARFYDVSLEAGAQYLEEVVVTDYAVPLIDKDNTTSGGTVTANEIRKMPNRNANSISTTVGGVSSIRGSRSAQSTEYISGQQVATPTNIRYEVSVPYTIPSDGEKYVVRIIDHKVPTDYEHHSIPKLDEDVYLMARLTDWSDLNLLSGKSAIYFEGAYMGKSFFDARQTEDTLLVSIGRDNNVIVVREQVKEMKSSQLLGGNVKESRGYKLMIRNNRSVAVKLKLEDQIPVSNNKEIDVEVLELSEAEFNEETGKLVWDVELSSKDNVEYKFGYSVKYPKNKVLILD